MIELTDQQREALKHAFPPQIVDPATNETYVLVRTEVFERMQQLLGESVYTTAELLDRTMAEDDALDPHLAELQEHYADKGHVARILSSFVFHTLAEPV